jgi:hypothetical protein
MSSGPFPKRPRPGHRGRAATATAVMPIGTGVTAGWALTSGRGLYG